jgi:hypothetical protein
LAGLNLAGLSLEISEAFQMLAGTDPGSQTSVRELAGLCRQAVAEFAVQIPGVAEAQQEDVSTENAGHALFIEYQGLKPVNVFYEQLSDYPANKAAESTPRSGALYWTSP